MSISLLEDEVILCKISVRRKDRHGPMPIGITNAI